MKKKLFFRLSAPVLAAVCLLFMVAPATAENTPRIVGGQEIFDDRFPFMARVYFYNATEDAFFPGCGGSIISNDAILSAAHCFVDRATGQVQDPANLRVVLGLTDLSSANIGQESVFQISEVIVHPQYNANNFQNDIAILRLSTTTNIPAIALPTTSTVLPTNNETLTVAGWGAVAEGGNQSLQLKAVELNAISQAECFPFYNNSTSPVVESIMICARGDINGGEDSCQGDSGGPLFANRSGQFVQAGVVSFGEGCARRRIPGVYTRATAFTDWVQSFVSNISTFQGDTTPTNPVSDVPVVSASQTASGTVLEGEVDVYNVTGFDEVSLTTQSGDADLLVTAGSSFSVESIVCTSELAGTAVDSCAIDSTAPELYAIVYGYEDSNYRIDVTRNTTPPVNPPVTVTTNDPVVNPPSSSANDDGGSASFSIIMLLLGLPLLALRRVSSGISRRQS